MRLSKLLNFADRSVIDGVEVENFVTHWRGAKTLLEIKMANEEDVWLEDVEIHPSPIDGQPLPFTSDLDGEGYEVDPHPVDLKCYVFTPLSEADWEGA